MASKTGTSMTRTPLSAQQRRRYARRRREEERRWAEQSGPVKIYYREPREPTDLPAA